MVFYLYKGPSEDAENFQHEQRGVIPRSFEYMYSLITREKELVSKHTSSYLNA
jgi:hypothetical protein